MVIDVKIDPVYVSLYELSTKKQDNCIDNLLFKFNFFFL
jgi:hypothetical protein